MKHSSIVGGSTAKRVIKCPGSVKLVARMPPQSETSYTASGTLLHQCMDDLLNNDITVQDLLGRSYKDIKVTQEMIDEKLTFAIKALDIIDPRHELAYQTEVHLDFGDFLPGVFGNCDLMGRIGKRAIILDWKFGDGVAVDAEENEQLMFYAAGALRTHPGFFEGAEEFELIIVQPPQIKRWVTDRLRLRQFELELKAAVETASLPHAPTQSGAHCRFCTAKPVCPSMNGAVDRALKTSIDALDKADIADALRMADMLDGWATDVRGLALRILESGATIPGYKLVAKRATRQWADETKARAALLDMGLKESDVTKTELLSPAQAEKVLKKHKLQLPEDQVVAVSSGNTLAAEDDPRPAVVLIGQQITAALSKLQ